MGLKRVPPALLRTRERPLDMIFRAHRVHILQVVQSFDIPAPNMTNPNSFC
jgi:hypothetical protein